MNSYTDFHTTHCWNCRQILSDKNSKRCPICGGLICPDCGSCYKDCKIFDNEGYNRSGYDIHGYDRQGYNRKGFDRNGLHKNGTYYDNNGFNVDGLNSDGYDCHGYNVDGYNRFGFNKDGYNKSGYDINGYDINGFNISGIHINGTYYDENHKNINGISKYDIESEKYKVGSKILFKSKIGIIAKRKSDFRNNIIHIIFDDKSETMLDLNAVINNDLIKIL